MVKIFLILILCVNIFIAGPLYAAEWKWTAFKASDRQAVKGLAQVCEILSTEPLPSYTPADPETNSRKYMLSINFQNLTGEPIDLGDASFYGVYEATLKEFKFELNREKTGGPILMPGKFAVFRCLFPVNGSAVKEIRIKLKDGREIKYYKTGHKGISAQEGL